MGELRTESRGSEGYGTTSRFLRYLFSLLLVGLAYFAAAKFGLALASINPSASPIWPPTGLAFAAVLLFGYRIWPAIFLAAFVVNASTAGSIYTSIAIAAGNTLEAVSAGYLLNAWAHGRHTLDLPLDVAKFGLVALFATMISATIGVGALTIANFAAPGDAANIWMTWWLGDLAGAIVVAPVVLLWWPDKPQKNYDGLMESLAIFVTAAGVGVIAFGPMFAQTGNRSWLGFLAVLPLLWAALRGRQRDTAAAAVMLSLFAVWGTASGGGPFARANLNESFLLLLMFMIATALPSLVLGAAIAERMQAEAGLRRARDELDRRVRVSEKNYRLLIDGIRDCAIFLLDLEGRVVSWNPGAERIKGYAAAEIIGEHFSRFYTAEDLQNRVPERALQQAKRDGKFEIEGWRLRKDGSRFWASVIIDCIVDEEGNPIGFAKITRDTSEKREAQLAHEHTKEQLAQSQKMEALGQLTGGVAHDFNNLLTIVSGQADVLRKRLTDAKDLKALDAIKKASTRGASLTRQLLSFSRRQGLEPTVTDLGQGIDDLRDILSGALRGDIELAIEIPPELWNVEVDRAELELALLNIAVNARDAMPSGGKFELSFRNATLNDRIGERDLQGEFVAIRASDTGEGIPPEIVSKIFDPFFTTKDVGKGTGLGLSQVFGFANQSGGAVRVDSVVGRGTSVTLFIPRSHASVPAPVEIASENARREPATILVVEDNEDIGDVTSEMLEHLGHDVVRAPNAAAALGVLRGGKKIDLLFSDIVMSGMNGVELARLVRAHYPDVEILLTTGYADVANSTVEFHLLRKPFEATALEKMIYGSLTRRKSASGATARPPT